MCFTDCGVFLTSQNLIGEISTSQKTKRRKHFTLKKSFKKGKEKVIGERQKVYSLIQKYFDGEMQRCVGGIGNRESKRLYGQFVSSTNFIRLVNCDSTITFQRFANGTKVSYRNAASENCSQFIYLC